MAFNLKRIAASAIGKGAALAGRTYDYATPGAGTSRLTQWGRNVADPNVNAYGMPHGQAASGNGIDNGTGGQISEAVAKLFGGGGNTGVLGASTGGVYSQGANGGGGDAPDPNLDPTRIAQERANIGGLYGTFEQALQNVFGKIDQMAAEKKASIVKDYGDQNQSVKDNLVSSTGQINRIMSSNNVANSSYNAEQQGMAQQAAETAMNRLKTAQEGDLANLGGIVESNKAKLRADVPVVNANDYNKVDDLLSIKESVDQAIRKLGASGAELGSDSSYIQALNTIAPQKETASTALKAQVDKLITTSAPDATKRYLIGKTAEDAGDDPNQWLDYYDKTVRAQTGAPVA